MLIVFFRVFVLYALIVFAIRLMGKRQIGELQPSELVVTILVSNIASLPMEDVDVPMFMGVIPILVIVSVDVIMSNLSLKSRTIRRAISGSPKIVVSNGEINQKELANLRYSLDDLMEALREKDIYDIRDVQYAIVETTGRINVFPKFSARPATAAMLSLAGPSRNPPSVIVSDGVVMQESLRGDILTQEWLRFVLDQHHVRAAEVFLLTADEQGEYVLVPKAAANLGKGR